MTRRRRLLAPLDLSLPTRDGVAHALAVARELTADIEFLYVASPGTIDAQRNLRWPSQTRERSFGDVRIHQTLLEGSPAQVIAEQAESLDVAAILLTSKRLGSWTRFWRGSVA